MTRHHPLTLSALAACAVLSLAAVARADAYDATLARAIAAKERALDTNDPASWEDALALFQQADRIRSTKESKYELAGAAARLRQDDLAVEAYESALALGLDGAARDKARAFIDEHASAMGRLVVEGPAGAEVWVGTRQRGVLPLGRPLVVFAGKTRIRLVHDGREQRRELDVEPGGEQRVAFVAKAPREVKDDAARVTPPARPETGTPDRVSPVEPSSNIGLPLLIAGGATAAVGLGVAIGASNAIDARRERLAGLCAVLDGTDRCTTAEPGRRDAAQDEVDAIATWKAIRVGGWIGLGLGAAAAVTGVVLLLGDSDDTPRARAGVVVSPLPGGASIGLAGTL